RAIGCIRHPDLVGRVAHEVPTGHAQAILRREIEHLAAIDLREHALTRGGRHLIQPTNLVVRAVRTLRYLEFHGSVLSPRVAPSCAPCGCVFRLSALPQTIGASLGPRPARAAGRRCALRMPPSPLRTAQGNPQSCGRRVEALPHLAKTDRPCGPPLWC